MAESFPQRVTDTGTSDTGFVGATIGAAAEGMCPIVGLMFVDRGSAVAEGTVVTQNSVIASIS